MWNLMLLIFSRTQPFLIAFKNSGGRKAANYICPGPEQKTMKTIKANSYTQQKWEVKTTKRAKGEKTKGIKMWAEGHMPRRVFYTNTHKQG